MLPPVDGSRAAVSAARVIVCELSVPEQLIVPPPVAMGSAAEAPQHAYRLTLPEVGAAKAMGDERPSAFTSAEPPKRAYSAYSPSAAELHAAVGRTETTSAKERVAEACAAAVGAAELASSSVTRSACTAAERSKQYQLTPPTPSVAVVAPPSHAPARTDAHARSLVVVAGKARPETTVCVAVESALVNSLK
jgi:hypothetical protein